MILVFRSDQRIEKKIRLTFVGTTKANKKRVPPEFYADKKRIKVSGFYGFASDVTPQSFVPKPRTAVNVVLSMHNVKLTDQYKNIPEVVIFYN